MKSIMLVLLCTALGACSSTREMYTPEGSIVYAISCRLQSYDACIEKAGELCGRLGYKVVLADGSPLPQTASQSVPGAAAAASPAPGTPAAGNLWQRKYYVRCHS